MKLSKHSKLLVAAICVTTMPLQMFPSNTSAQERKETIRLENLIKIHNFSDQQAESARENLRKRQKKIREFLSLTEEERIKILDDRENDAREKIALIKIGMTREKVEAILGDEWVNGVSAHWTGLNNVYYSPVGPHLRSMLHCDIMVGYGEDIRLRMTCQI